MAPAADKLVPIKPDAACAAAVDLARAGAVETAGDASAVGDHLGTAAEGERTVTHRFAALLPGYVGWHWAVTVARASRAKLVTVDEVVLLPGDGALLAPEWVPWSQRLQPGDLAPGDLLPSDADDTRLVPAWFAGDPSLDDEDPDESGELDIAREVGLGRVRVLSPEGRLDAAERWRDGDGGPDSPMAKQAPGHCVSCGFLVPLRGSLRAAFGVCANEFAGDDGRVVTTDHGCGAHSEAVTAENHYAEPTGEIYDDAELVVDQN